MILKYTQLILQRNVRFMIFVFCIVYFKIVFILFLPSISYPVPSFCVLCYDLSFIGMWSDNGADHWLW